MCTDCGCHTPAVKTRSIESHEPLLAANQMRAEQNRALFASYALKVINLMSAPGSGKTSLLEATARHLAGKRRSIAVIEGDLQTDNDAARLRACGVQAVQITTGNACHLDAEMIANAAAQLPLAELDYLFIENVGNLVCPAAFDLGQQINVVLLSAAEGDDKPSKYPPMFHAADVFVISKTDLLPHMDDFSAQRAKDNFRKLNGRAPMLMLSSKADDIHTWLALLENLPGTSDDQPA